MQMIFCFRIGNVLVLLEFFEFVCLSKILCFVQNFQGLSCISRKNVYMGIEKFWLMLLLLQT